MSTSEHIFLSYRSLDVGFALRLASMLQKAGLNIWVDRLPGGIGAGDDWPVTIERAINTCRALIAVISPDYVNSTVARQELHRAFLLGRPIVPIVLKTVKEEDWPLEIQRLQYVSFVDWRNDHAFRAATDFLMSRLRSDFGEVAVQRPDPERQHLLAFIAEQEASGGVAKYTELAAELSSRDDPAPSEGLSLVSTWGLDAEFSLLETNDAWAAKKPERKTRIESILRVLDTPRKFVLLGDPGAGKSTTLRRLALETARRRLANPRESPLPIFIHLSTWVNEPDLIGLIEAHWPFIGDPGPALQRGDVALFLDGLNEMGANSPTKARLIENWLKSESGPAGVIVTCRSQDYDSRSMDLGVGKITIEAMDSDRIHRFVEAYLGERRGSEFLSRILPERLGGVPRKNLYALTRNPYLLTCLMLISQSAPNRELPRNMGTLFRGLIQFLWKREVNRQTQGWIPFEEAERRFASLAFRIIDEDLPTSFPRNYAATSLGGTPVVHIGLSANILESEGDDIRFYHQLIQDYLAGFELNRIGVESRVEPPKRESSGFRSPDRLVAGRWDEAIVAACGIAADPDKMICSIAGRNLFVASRGCLGVAISQSTFNLIVNGLLAEYNRLDQEARKCEREWDDYSETFRVLGSSSQHMAEDAFELHYDNDVTAPLSDVVSHLKLLADGHLEKWRRLAALNKIADLAISKNVQHYSGGGLTTWTSKTWWRDKRGLDSRKDSNPD